MGRYAAAAVAGPFLAAAGGCASMHGHEKIHVVRTDPSGQRVVDEFGRPLGTSPLYVALPRSQTLRLGVVAEPGDPRSTRWFDMECSYRWLASGVLNVPGAGQGFDLLTGAAWDCPANISLRPKGPQERPPATEAGGPLGRCGRFLAVVPRHFTAWETERLAKAWLAVPRADARACDRFASAAEGEALLERYGLTRTTRLEQWDDWRLRQIAGSLDLTHIVFFERAPTAEATDSYTIRRYDVFRDTEGAAAEAAAESSLFVTPPGIEVPSSRTPPFYSWRRLQRILPNAVVGGWEAGSATWELRETDARYRASNPASLFFTMTDFDWREKYRPWDWSYKILSTELGLFYGSDHVRAEEKYRSDGKGSGDAGPANERRLAPAMRVSRLAVTAHLAGGIAGHAPLASFFLRAGVGSVYSRLSGHSGSASKLIPLSFHFRYGTLVHMGPAWLVIVEGTATTVGHAYGRWELASVTGGRAGLGYVFPSPPIL